MNGTILLAGASGALGLHLAAELRARGYGVRALTRDPSRLGARKAAFDQVHAGDALVPATLAGAFDGVRAVISTVGASTQPGLGRGWRSFAAVDVPANHNLIAAARAARVEKLVYVSVFKAPEHPRLQYMRAHETVVDTLRASGLAYAVVRPTGFYSALGEFVRLAAGGVVPEIGDGTARTNPIHDADLAAVCVDALAGDVRERDAGGPDVLTRREIIELAFAAVGRPVKIRRVPLATVRFASVMLRPAHPRIAHLMAFFSAIMSEDFVAPVAGARTIKDFFAEYAASLRGDRQLTASAR